LSLSATLRDKFINETDPLGNVLTDECLRFPDRGIERGYTYFTLDDFSA
jgi:hypothetical protein